MTPSSKSRDQKVANLSQTMGHGFNKKGKGTSMAAATALNWRNGRQSAIEPQLNQDIEEDLSRAIDMAIDMSST